jgi:hypothetical protein
MAIPGTVKNFDLEEIFIAVAEKIPLNLVNLNLILKFIPQNIEKITFFSMAKPDEDTGETEKYLSELQKLYGENFTTNYDIFQGNNVFEDMKTVVANRDHDLLNTEGIETSKRPAI